MQANFSPSVNIVRDESQEIDYIVTPNARKVVSEIEDLIQKGFSSFSIIGSYGSGKSVFLWAFEKSVKKEKDLFEIDLGKQYTFLKIVGEYRSLQEVLADKLGSSLSVDEVLSQLKNYSQKKPLILLIDEFGKFIEYAVRNEPEREIYFLQQLAEFVGDSTNNCLLVTTLHQSFDAYSSSFLNAAERNEWRKVKGRFKDLTFNEPVEQLLYLAARRISNQNSADSEVSAKTIELQKKHLVVKAETEFLEEISTSLWPLDIFSAYLLAIGLQRYGQNERSLFTFLEGEFDKTSSKHLIISDIYDYLHHEFYSYLRSDKNFDYNGWRGISTGIERTETIYTGNINIAQDIIKIIGLISLLGHKGARLDRGFLVTYLDHIYKPKEISASLKELEDKKIILFTRYNNAFRIFEGTDVDFAEELKEADKNVDDQIDIPTKLKEYFNFSVVNAKSNTYHFGTPRFFEYIISEFPIEDTPTKQIDGFINLVFNKSTDTGELKKLSLVQNETLYAVFKNVEDVKELLIDIERTTKAKAKNNDDLIARKEFDNILTSQRQLLNRHVLDALFTDQVTWMWSGKVTTIKSNKELNQVVSRICDKVYSRTPVFRNELANRHILQGGIAAKKPFYKALVENYHMSDLGFSDSLFPPEKTIYLSLLRETGIHRQTKVGFEFSAPSKHFKDLWKASEDFIESCKSERRKVSELYDSLSVKPFKLTPGFLDFWVPAFLFIKRDDFALFNEKEGYQPEMTDTHLYFFTRDPAQFEIKTFDVKGVKLDLYNKYRELLELKDEDKFNNKSLIESVKPFMVFYHQLNDYAKTTNRISKEAKVLRQSIEKAEDPEKLFFEQFPKAIGVELKELLASEELFDEYIVKLREAIRDLQGCFDRLVDRIELFILTELLHDKKLSFKAYKKKIEIRYSHLKEHMLIPNQSGLLIRLRAPLDDRNSWINSICHVIMGKPLEALRDKEEDILKDKLAYAFQELDNLNDLSKASTGGEEKMLKIGITSLDDGMKEQVIHLPKELDDDALDTMNKVKEALGKNKKLNKFILVNLLDQELDE